MLVLEPAPGNVVHGLNRLCGGGQVVVYGAWGWFPSGFLPASSSAPRLLPPYRTRASEYVSSESDGTVRGERNCSARGEILRSLQDPLQRRRYARTCSSIKDESLGSEDDQTPS